MGNEIQLYAQQGVSLKEFKKLIALFQVKDNAIFMDSYMTTLRVSVTINSSHSHLFEPDDSLLCQEEAKHYKEAAERTKIRAILDAKAAGATAEDFK